MWLAKTVAKLVVLTVVAIGLLGASSATAIPARPAYPLSPSQSGDFAVDSFFDITYEIEFVGAPGSVLDSMAGATQGTVRVDVNADCVVPDNGTGTVDLPPLGCEYQSIDDVWMIIDGLPPGTTIEIDAILKDFFNTLEIPGGNLGGHRQTYDAIMEQTMTGTGALTGFNRYIPMQIAVVTDSGPRTPGDPVQSFDTNMVSLYGEIYGDPDFDVLIVEAGTNYGFPSPGHTTLTEEMDYGDAPEGENAIAYPSTGTIGSFPTCKTIGPAGWIQHDNYGAYFGQSLDKETDGNWGLCPGCFPSYDDDECFMDIDSGLRVPEPFTIDSAVNVVPCANFTGTPLANTCQTAVWGTDVDIEVHNHMPNDTIGYVNVLMDWNQDGVWGGSSICPGGTAPEHVLVNYQVPNPPPSGYGGLLSAILPPPGSFLTGPNVGYVWTRFTITERPVTLPWTGEGVFEDGETEDYLLWIEEGEIEHKMHFPQYPDPDGWDVNATEPNILADDFLCTASGPITNVVFWGSWRDDQIGEILNMHLSFHEDDRTGPFSKPGVLLWEWNTNVFEMEEVEPPSWQGWYDPNTGEELPSNHQQYFRFDVPIPEEFAFVQEEGNIYWLDLQFIAEGGMFGVKTSLDHFEDDAVWGITPGPFWQELFDPLSGESLDLAFVIQGEDVEELDFGDAPDSPAAPGYPTLLGNSAASHVIVPNGPFMGSTPVDAETDGQPNSDATGDDLDGNDDEDGVTFGVIVAGNTAADVTIQLSNAADCVVNAWIDFDGDQTWSMGAPEQILTDVSMTAGSTVMHNFPVPLNAKVGVESYARVRCATASDLLPTGPANDGEVEDYKVKIDGYDYGDAPDPPYATLHATTFSGAAHIIDPDFLLGTLIDAEYDGQPDADALGDDNTNLQDEDGITFLSPLIPGQQACIQVDVINNTSYNAALAAWIDFNGNGTWETAEHLFDPSGGASEPLPASSNIKCFDVPVGAKSGPTFGRFRLDPNVIDPTPYGTWFLGEVEDYKVHISAKKWDQPPILSNEPPYPECFWGWDEISEYELGPIVADDWLCEDDRPVTDIHWWGSYVDWDGDSPPGYAPTDFHIGIWTDVPEGVTDPWSHPGEMIKEWVVDRGDLDERVVGCDFHSTMLVPDTCFAYDFEILLAKDWFIQDPGPTVYWLSIAAIYESEPPQEFAWGWKTREHNWNDAAIRMFDPLHPTTGAQYGAGEPIMLDEVPWDMAFIVTTQPGPPEAPDVDIDIVATDDAELSWPHVEYDIYGNLVNVTKYLIYRETAPYFSTAPVNLAKTYTDFTPSGTISWTDPDRIGDPTINYYYFVVAVTQDINGNDVLSALSNHVGEFDFALVKGAP